MVLLLVVTMQLVLGQDTGVVHAHDPSTWGGLYRSRDNGATWLLANEGRFVTAALALAIDPVDPNHLLLATDSGLLRSRNGGRDWDVDGPSVLVGGVYAVAFDSTGARSLASTGAGLFVRDEVSAAWRAAPTPPGSVPARAIVPGAAPDRVYVLGWNGLFRSDDWGDSWRDIAEGLPPSGVTTLVLSQRGDDALLAVTSGTLWASADGGRSWHQRDNGLPVGRLQAVAATPGQPDRFWAAGDDRLFLTDDHGASWQPVGNALNEAGTDVRGIGAGAEQSRIVLATDRGLFFTQNGAATWELLGDNLPIHLESRPLVRDTADESSLYAGFSIVPYEPLWQVAAEGGSTLSRIDPVNLMGAAAFIVLLVLGTHWLLRWLSRYYGPASPPAPPRVLTGGPLGHGR
jgi:photosystem II stability/assembly factor-like uncharacterized protein